MGGAPGAEAPSCRCASAPQESEVLEIKRRVSRKDLVLAAGWLEVTRAKGAEAAAGSVVLLHVEALAVVRNHTVWVTPDMPAEERELEVRLGSAYTKPHTYMLLSLVYTLVPGSTHEWAQSSVAGHIQ